MVCPLGTFLTGLSLGLIGTGMSRLHVTSERLGGWAAVLYLYRFSE